MNRCIDTSVHRCRPDLEDAEDGRPGGEGRARRGRGPAAVPGPSATRQRAACDRRPARARRRATSATRPPPHHDGDNARSLDRHRPVAWTRRRSTACRPSGDRRPQAIDDPRRSTTDVRSRCGSSRSEPGALHGSGGPTTPRARSTPAQRRDDRHGPDGDSTCPPSRDLPTRGTSPLPSVGCWSPPAARAGPSYRRRVTSRSRQGGRDRDRDPCRPRLLRRGSHRHTA
jgi:hypothetical protein